MNSYDYQQRTVVGGLTYWPETALYSYIHPGCAKNLNATLAQLFDLMRLLCLRLAHLYA